jgi:hypothetical protein
MKSVAWGCFVTALALLGAAPDARAASASPACPPPVEEQDAGALPHLGAALKPGATINILSLGAVADAKPTSGLTQPAAPTGFFAQLSHALEAGVKGLHTQVTVRGGRGLLAPNQLDLMRTALAQHAYQVVLWQTGTVDAVQDEPPEDFYRALSDGADAVSQSNADLILVEPQYSRFLEANADLSPYLSAMQEVGATTGAVVFHRYDLMHDWEDAGLIDLEHASMSDRPAVAARLHTCLAAELARTLLTGAAGVR